MKHVFIIQLDKLMNRIFGFFKQKLVQVKQQNKQELQTLANALTQNEYSTERVLTMLQSIKSNYMNWNILIANEASTGLYYSQVHNRNICLRKIKNNQELSKNVQKNKSKLAQIRGIGKELKEIRQLNGKWIVSVNDGLEGINEYVNHLLNKDKYNQKMKQFQLQSKLEKERVRQQQDSKQNNMIIETGDLSRNNEGQNIQNSANSVPMEQKSSQITHKQTQPEIAITNANATTEQGQANKETQQQKPNNQINKQKKQKEEYKIEEIDDEQV